MLWDECESLSHQNSILRNFYVTFDLKRMKFVGVFFKTENHVMFFYFSVKAQSFREQRCQNERLNYFRIKWIKRSHIMKPIRWNSNFIIFTKKWKTPLESFSLRYSCFQNSFIQFHPKVDCWKECFFTQLTIENSFNRNILTCLIIRSI